VRLLTVAKIEVNGQGVALPSSIDTVVAADRKIGGYHEVGVLIDISHFACFHPPICHRVLDDTDSVDPDISYA
jgi:hypothetical protein